MLFNCYNGDNKELWRASDQLYLGSQGVNYPCLNLEIHVYPGACHELGSLCIARISTRSSLCVQPRSSTPNLVR